VVTGNPAFSLTGTRRLAEELGRPRSVTLAPLLAPTFLATVTGLPVLLAGAVGLAVFSDRPPRQFLIVLGVFALTLLSFVVIGAAGLPLLARYMFPPAVLLILLGCGAAIGSSPMRRTTAGRLATVGAAIALLAAVPGTARGVRHAIEDSLSRRAVQADLRDLVAQPAFGRAVGRCGTLSVAIYRLAPAVAYAAGVLPQTIDSGPPRGVLVLPRSGRAVTSLTSAGDDEPPLLRPPSGFALDRDAQSDDWAVAVAASCPDS
jgi:hypothetical protein